MTRYERLLGKKKKVNFQEDPSTIAMGLYPKPYKIIKPTTTTTSYPPLFFPNKPTTTTTSYPTGVIGTAIPFPLIIKWGSSSLT